MYTEVDTERPVSTTVVEQAADTTENIVNELTDNIIDPNNNKKASKVLKVVKTVLHVVKYLIPFIALFKKK